MVVISHPVGNQNVRQALLALRDAGLLDCFHTTVCWNQDSKLNALLPRSIRAELNRRSYPQIPKNRIRTNVLRETLRLLSPRLGLPQLDTFSILKVANAIDRKTAATIKQRKPKAVYAYEGVALESFRIAKQQGTACIYELPSGYWYYEGDLLREEAGLRPEYAGTIEKLRDTPEHLQAKDQELSFADYVIVSSQHIRRTLQASPVSPSKIRVIPYGANETLGPIRILSRSSNRKLRVLFVGGLTQRKGIGYLLDAIESLGSSVELTMIGRKVGTSACIDKAVQKNHWIPSLPYHAVLDKMSQHDVLVLPSITEGFGLVVTEALSRGLPIITTKNAGSSEVIRDGQNGFIVPIRSAEAIATRLQTLHRDPDLLDRMSASAWEHAREFSWKRYRDLLVSTIANITN